MAHHLDFVLHLSCLVTAIAGEDKCHRLLLTVEHGLNVFERLSLGKDGRLIQR